MGAIAVVKLQFIHSFHLSATRVNLQERNQ